MNQTEEGLNVYSAHSDISRLQPVPAHLFGTRRAVFYLMGMRSAAGEGARSAAAPDRDSPRIAALWRDLLQRDEFRL